MLHLRSLILKKCEKTIAGRRYLLGLLQGLWLFAVWAFSTLFLYSVAERALLIPSGRPVEIEYQGHHVLALFLAFVFVCTLVSFHELKRGKAIVAYAPWMLAVSCGAYYAVGSFIA